MKEVFLKKLILKNFKKIQDLTVEFTDKNTFICGGNGTGKTTLQDAFLWLLFGKDSTNRADTNFNIKTLGEDGKPILHLVHSVTGVLSINGRDVELQRNYVEKWGSGVNAGVLQNHATEFYLNGVKLKTKKEYDAEVAAILPEDVFRMITNPLYFPTMKAQDQKAMLLEMAGNVTNEEVANINPKFQELISLISGRTLEQLAKEIASKKSAIKDELKGIPGRIDSVRDAMPESEDWAVLEKEIADKKEKIKDIDSQLADKSKQIEAEFKAKSELQKQIGNKKLAKSQRENEIRQNANKSYHDVLDNISKLEYQVKSKDAEISRKQEDHSRIKANIEALNNDLEVLRGKFYAIDAETLQYPEGAFICPTCKRELEVEDIQAKQQELQDNFNLNKANRLKAVQNEGKEKAAKVEELKKQCSIIQATITQLSNEKEILVHNINECKGNMPEEQDTQKIILSDPTWLSLSNEIVDLENQLKAEAKPIDTTELKEAKAILSEAIDELNKKLGKRDTIERSNKVIENLEDRRDKNNEALAEQERLEFLVQDFQKEKDNKLMERINGMFSLVKFSFISEKLNGNEAITCFCSVDGVPFADVNNASKINAGLDIINAICRSVGITAPIFIDNRESVNDLIPTMSQVINLVVSKDKSLMIRVAGNGTMEEYKQL
ncbi:ATP-binding protein [Phocaeicola massiliensis]|uniref:ATP-binding protein n=1 Tax=Phocaeicola massiliensis TaxID=204516 RepID=UPI0022E3BE12|nr:ATP-binding protein [Phocaeicola massiliensis]